MSERTRAALDSQEFHELCMDYRGASILGAQQAYERLQNYIAALAAPETAAEGWISVEERLPASGITVLACYRNQAGNLRRIRACWVKAKNVESGYESEIGEYDEGDDCYYDPEGWYEQIDNWDDYTAIAVHEPVTHWMPLPRAPNTKEADKGASGSETRIERGVSRHVLKAEPERADATDCDTTQLSSPGVGPMGVGQPADAGAPSGGSGSGGI